MNILRAWFTMLWIRMSCLRKFRVSGFELASTQNSKLAPLSIFRVLSFELIPTRNAKTQNLGKQHIRIQSIMNQTGRIFISFESMRRDKR